ncbi:MAG: lipoate--protein ligase family protein [Promethearchaeota archaeon]
MKEEFELVIRYVRDKGYHPAVGLAIDEVLMNSLVPASDIGSRGRNSREDKSGKGVEYGGVVRTYYFTPPSVVLGLNQNPEEVDWDAIQARELAISRRLTGGGVIIIGCPEEHSQVGISVFARPEVLEVPVVRLRDKFRVYTSGTLQAIREFGIDATYNPNSDIEVGGKKICGSAFYGVDEVDFLHSTVLFQYDIDTMLEVAGSGRRGRGRSEETGKNSGGVAPKFTTFERELGREWTPEDCRLFEDRFLEGIREALGEEVVELPLTPEEEAAANALAREKYFTPEWIYSEASQTGSMGACFLKKVK